ncbi:MAG: glycoside hydrolase family 65 protein [Clostridiales bacterium]|jgi:kojibiose phosphorylase/nigerose phosphorylase|nr:glycoside hydrolase family 65 protein [Clostridiales bacterium]
MDVWKVISEGYNEQDAVDCGNRFLIGNGFVGIRGTLEEYRKDKQAACTLAGVYDKAENQTWREPVNIPNGFYAHIENPGEIESHTQCLDIKTGVHSRITEYKRAVLTIERFANMACVNTICQKITVIPKCAEVTLKCGIDSDVWDINGPHLMDLRAQGGEVISVSARTYEQDIPISVSERCDQTGYETVTENNSVYRVFKISEPFTVKRIIVINAGNEGVHENCGETLEGHTAVYESVAGTYDEMLEAHTAVWAKLWENSAVILKGDDEAQLALNYSLYHLHSIAPRHADNLSIAARGLSGQTYKGAVFWDTEIFLMPFFMYTEPETAKKLINYRIKTIDGAMKKAEEYGFKGAFYAWESQDGGAEGCTDFNVIDVFTERPVRTSFRDKQIHISGDIVYALLKYARWTGDNKIFDYGGIDLICACADFYKSRAYCRVGEKELEFPDVVGPDEYHERVDNNAFTNRIADLTLNYAKNRYKVRKPRLRDGIIEQFDGYFDLEDASLETVRSRLKHKREYWGTQSGVAFATQIIKQADVLAMMNLFPEDYTKEDFEKNWFYYEPRTEHGSSLSACMYALGACRFGRADLAYPMFLKSARADLDGGGKSWAGNVFIGGTHPASAGGAYMIVTQGFAGLKQEDNSLTLNPCLPKEIESIEFPVIFRGEKYKIKVTQNTSEIERVNNV